MLAGVARIIEICFIDTDSPVDSQGDGQSDHTLADSGNSGMFTTGNGKASAGKALRHLTPFECLHHLDRSWYTN
jgi:hypothetical protein